MKAKEPRNICYWDEMAEAVGCKWRVVEATIYLTYRGSTYRAVVAADVPYHLTEALRRDDPRFKDIQLQDWKHAQILSMAPPRKDFARAELLSIREVQA